ncbi:MAG TPA: head-tail adaptor protein [Devosiaceae bacterium]|jgi:hypothetical protein
MRSGSLDRTVTVIQRVEIGRDPDYNTPIFEEQTFAIKAQLTNQAEDEKFAASQVYESRVVTFTTRMFALDATATLECEGVSYGVIGIRQIGRRRGLEIKAKAAL